MPRIPSSRNGQSFLALVFLIGAIVTIVGILIAFLANAFVDRGYGFSAAAAADAAANSGVQDAMLQIQRNPTLSLYPCPSSGYSLVVGSTTANVCISQGTPVAGEVTILSTATVSGRTRKLNVVLSVNSSTAQTSIISWQEIQ